MSDVDVFLAQMLPRYLAAADAMHNGDPAGFRELWTRNDPVTLLGAAGATFAGWEDVSRAQAVGIPILQRYAVGRRDHRR
jgi:hypothetical protein